MATKLKIEKRGDEIKKKIFSSETTQPKYAEMILGWSPSKMASTAELNLT
jgi:hypothetical protein